MFFGHERILADRIALLGFVKMQRARRIGLTGGIGSGKARVAQILAQAGAAIIDADAISRSLTSAGGLAVAPIEAAFWPQAINAQGALNRAFMRDLIFQDPCAKAALGSRLSTP